MPENDYKRHFVLFGYAVIIFITVWALLYAAFHLMLPFVISWMIALLFRPIVNKAANKLKMPRRLTGALILILLVALGSLIAGALISRAVSEIKVLARNVGDNAGTLASEATEFIEKWMTRLHISAPEDPRYVADTVAGVLQNLVTALTASLPSRLGAFLTKLPEYLFVTVVFLMASFYLISDFNNVNRFFARLLPERTVKLLSNIKNSIFSTSVRYFRAYMIILLITFAQLLIAFLILKIKYALLLAALIALLDLLPAVGVGTVMVPWALICFLSGRPGLGAGLLVAFVIITVMREISESHVIGSQLGIPAIVTLLSVYVGLRCAGIPGMLIGPFAALLIKNIALFCISSTEKDKAPSVSGE